MRSWDDALALHRRAVAEYLSTAEGVVAWDRAPGPDKWSPAQVTAHLNLAFEAILCELGGGPPMALRTRWYHRVILRFTIQRRLLRGGPFPHGARAPRETRPPTEATADQATSLAEFRRLGDEVNAALAAAGERKDKFRFRHPYFGYMRAADAVYTAARHIDHHRGQITGR
jgi:hypothetical protein